MLMEIWVQFSLTDLFGEFFWYFIIIFKIMQVVLEWMEEGFFSNMEMMAIIGTYQAVVSGLITFGADDFLDFLLAFIVELGIMMAERVYVCILAEDMGDFLLDPMLDFVNDYFTEK
jgi:hypothetical protein